MCKMVRSMMSALSSCFKRLVRFLILRSQKPIFSRPVFALGKAFHERHLRCRHCREPIKGNPVEHNGDVYCERDYTALIAPKCAACRNAIQGETIYALNTTYHKECFACMACGASFPDKSFYVFGNEPLCKRHYHKRNNSLCGTCDDPIEGRVSKWSRVMLQKLIFVQDPVLRSLK